MRLALPVLLFLSGAAGLAYEVVWLRLFANTLGCSQTATVTVLAVFMAGLALGAALFGRRADRVARPLRLYALLELGIGGCALLLPSALGGVERLDRLLGGGIGGTGALIARAAAAGLVLLLPTMLMGGTLPAIAAWLARNSDRIGPVAGRRFTGAYAAQLLGAAAGTLAASFLLIPWLGLSGTSRLGALVNGAVALVAWRLGRAREEEGRAAGSIAPVVATPASAPAPALARPALASDAASFVRALPAFAFLSGFLLLGAEVIFARMLVMTVSAKVHSFALMLFVFLFGLAAASALVAKLPQRCTRGAAPLFGALLLGAAGLLAARAIALVLPEPLLLRVQVDGRIEPLAYVGLALLLSAATMLPVALPLGTLLPLALRQAAAGGGRAVARVVFWNTVGSVIGPLCVPFLLLPHFALLGTLFLFALVCLAVGALVAAALLVAPRPAWLRAVPLLLLAAVAVAAARSDRRFDGAPALDSTLFVATKIAARGGTVELPPRVLAHEEGTTCTVTVAESGNPRGKSRRSLRVDGFEAAAAPIKGTNVYQYLRLMAHLPALLHPGPIGRALVICCGTGTTAGAMTLHAREQVDLVDLHPEVLAHLSFFADVNRALAKNPACRKIADDGRAWLRRCDGKYDVITLEPMPPQHAGMTQLYSQEFYAAAKAALAPDGVVCQWLPWHLLNREQGLAITHAMTAVFPTVQVWEHKKTGILIGTTAAHLTLDAGRLAALRADPRIAADLDEAQLVAPASFTEAFLCDGASLAAALATVAPLADDRPTLEYGEVGYGLTQLTTGQEAEVRQPFFEARLHATLPLAGFSAEVTQSLTRDWQAQSVVRYGAYVLNTGGSAAAEAFVAEQTRAQPELAQSPLVADFLREVRARKLKEGPP